MIMDILTTSVFGNGMVYITIENLPGTPEFKMHQKAEKAGKKRLILQSTYGCKVVLKSMC